MITFRLPRPGIRLFEPNKILFLLWLFLLVFPKGGIKIRDNPLTWGYLLLAIVSVFRIFSSRFSVRIPSLQALLLIIPLQFIFILDSLINGVQNIGFFISFIVGFFFLPFVFFCLLSPHIETLNLNILARLIKKGMLFISAYGIFLFLFKLLTGNLIEIPFLTINFHDIGNIELKCNNRGFIFKLISTYNNGNIYGICMLIFLPLYSFLEKSKLRKITVNLSLILTFSRTVWIGIIFSTILSEILIYRRKDYFVLKLIFIPITISLGLALSILFFGQGVDFFFDPNLGGRLCQLNALNHVALIPNKPFSGISEIVYLGILEQLGFLGLISYLIAMLGPIFLKLSFFNKSSLFRTSCICGLFNYIFISCSDGALLLIPILVFYWFCSALVLRKTLNYPNNTQGTNQ